MVKALVKVKSTSNVGLPAVYEVHRRFLDAEIGNAQALSAAARDHGELIAEKVRQAWMKPGRLVPLASPKAIKMLESCPEASTWGEQDKSSKRLEVKDVAAALQRLMDKDAESSVYWVRETGFHEVQPMLWPNDVKNEFVVMAETGASEGTLLRVFCREDKSSASFTLLMTIKLLCGIAKAGHDIMTVQDFLSELDVDKALNGDFPQLKQGFAS